MVATALSSIIPSPNPVGGGASWFVALYSRHCQDASRPLQRVDLSLSPHTSARQTHLGARSHVGPIVALQAVHQGKQRRAPQHAAPIRLLHPPQQGRRQVQQPLLRGIDARPAQAIQAAQSRATDVPQHFSASSCAMAVSFHKIVAERGVWDDDLLRDAEIAWSLGTDRSKEVAMLKWWIAAERGSEIAQNNLAYVLDQGL